MWGRPVSSDCPHSTAHKRKSQINFRLGLLNWLNEVEVFAMLFAAAIHDYEHTGTTNTFHQQTRSNLGSFRVHTFPNFTAKARFLRLRTWWHSQSMSPRFVDFKSPKKFVMTIHQLR